MVGPTQNGKTLVTTNIPLLYFLFEVEEDVIFGLPSMDLASGMWSDKLRPVIEASPYADLLPTQGAGSRGGNFTSVRFKNGTTLRFMGAGGSAAQMSSHTSRVIIMTEIDKMDEAGGDGSEADPVSLIQKRCDAFEDSKILMECTVTNSEGRIWQEAMVSGSGGLIYVACPKCHGWQTLDRDGLVFDSSSQLKAEETARYKCKHCEELWTNNDRLEALQDPRLVHKGQEIDGGGNVVGELPETKYFGIQYNVLHSPLQSLAKTAGQQYDADTTELKEIKKDMIQSKWATPFVDEDVDRDKLTISYLQKRSATGTYPQKLIPDWADVVTFGTDIQKGYCFWMAEAYNLTTMRSIVLEYGTVDQREDTDAGLINMMSDVNEIALEGWAKESGGVQAADFKLVDCGFRYDVLKKWLPINRSWNGLVGRSRNEAKKMTQGKELYRIDGILSIRQQDDGNQLFFVEVDNTKGLVHDRYLITSEDVDGYRYVPNDVELSFFRHMTAEEREYDPLGESFKWVKKRRRNDYLDIASYNVAGAYFLRERGARQAKKKQQTERKNLEERRKQSARPTRGHAQHGGGGWFSNRSSSRMYS